MLSQRSLRLSSFPYILLFFFILFCGSYFCHSVSRHSFPFFCLSYSAIDSFQSFLCVFFCLFFSIIMLFITVLQFFQFLVKHFLSFLDSCLHSVSKILGSSLLSLLQILFQVDCLFDFHLFCLVGFYLVTFICKIFLCHLILSNFLCLWSPFCGLQDYSSSFWCLPPGG